MIRSSRIPAVLDRICDDDTIEVSLLVTVDGELLGCSSHAAHERKKQAALLSDMGLDYQRLGLELAQVLQRSDETEQDMPKSQLQCLLLESHDRLIGLTQVEGVDCFVIGIAKPTSPPGWIKARLQVLASYVQDALST